MILNKILGLIAEDELHNALTLLRQVFDDSSNLNSVIQQSGRLSNLEKGLLNGTISFEDQSIERNKIRTSILSLVQFIDSKSEDPDIQKELEELHTKGIVIQSHSGTGHNIGGNIINL
ncbi:MAG: hypothetical protein AAGI23_21295 [Bacteroidota bacterium]